MVLEVHMAQGAARAAGLPDRNSAQWVTNLHSFCARNLRQRGMAGWKSPSPWRSRFFCAGVGNDRRAAVAVETRRGGARGARGNYPVVRNFPNEADLRAGFWR